MPPQIFNYDPNAGIAAIQKSGQAISQILGEAKQAELQVDKQKKRSEAIAFLNETIRTRTDQSPGGMAGLFPMMDPIIREAAMAVSPVAKDYVDLLVSLHEKNVQAAKPMAVTGGYIELNPGTGKFEFRDTSPEAERAGSETVIESVFGRGATTNDILAISHLGDNDVFLTDENKQPVLDESGKPKIDQVRLAKKVKSDLVAVAGAKAAAGAAGVADVKEGTVPKEETRVAIKEFNEALAEMKTAGRSEKEIAELIGSGYLETNASGGKVVKRQYRDPANVMKATSQVEEFVAKWAKLPKEEKEKYRKQLGVVEGAPPPGAAIPADTGKVKWDDALE